MNLFEHFPVLVIDDQIKENNLSERALRKIINSLNRLNIQVIESTISDYEDNEWHITLADSEVSCIVLSWNKSKPNRNKTKQSKLSSLITKFRQRNSEIPILLMTDKLEIEDLPIDTINQINEFVWNAEDTPAFIAGRIEKAAKEYLEFLQPPFFKKLLSYTEQYKYSWHTPGHMGGMGFLRSPAGRIFFEFFGENFLRSDLSVSVPELGSILEHTSVVKDAEANAAKVFGADRTYFVTNGTSTSNRIVWQGVVNRGDIVLVDRNCHKSIMQAIILTGAIPIYLFPTRNDYGIIGPIDIKQLNPKAIKSKIKANPFIIDPDKKIKITTITNSTYDGICYDVKLIKNKLKSTNNEGLTENLHFDESWYAYANFNPMYKYRYATYTQEKDKAFKVIFATQSTHKMLTAFSQSSMIHVLDQSGEFSHERFNEAFMMHFSTSPQYGIIASLDVATKMMEGTFGNIATQTAIEEAVVFRKKMFSIPRILEQQEENWYFKVWQPPKIGQRDFDQVPDDVLTNDPNCWTLKPADSWHGFSKIEKGYVMLDPIKVTILTPGILEEQNTMEDWGIPAPIVSRFLRNKGIVAEKTGFYSILLLFSIGVTNGKSGTLLSTFFEFRDTYDKNPLLAEIFPELKEKYPPDTTLQELCQQMHHFLKQRNYIELSNKVYEDSDAVPTQHLLPSEAYQLIVSGKVKTFKLADINNKTSAVMVVPYPPGIPIIMPGEVFNDTLVSYLKLYEDFDKNFPGFENEMHSVEIKDGLYHIYCVE